MKNILAEAIEGVEEQEIDSNVFGRTAQCGDLYCGTGDDLWSIGRKYHMPVKTVRELNAPKAMNYARGRRCC